MQKIADYLLLHNRTRDNALGLIYPGRVTIELAYHVQREQEAQTERVFKAAVLNSLIQQGAKSITALVKQAQMQPDKARDILKQARQIESKIKKARKELKVLNG